MQLDQDPTRSSFQLHRVQALFDTVKERVFHIIGACDNLRKIFQKILLPIFVQVHGSNPFWTWTEPPERVHVGSVRGSGLKAELNFGHVRGSQILLKNWTSGIDRTKLLKSSG
jgi:hypothetical protein